MPVALAAVALLSCATTPTLRLLSSVDGAPATAAWKYVKLGQHVVLSAQLRPDVQGAHLRWFKLEPSVGSVDNTSPSFHFEKIPYVETELTACRDQATCPPDMAPPAVAKPSPIPGTGTFAFQVRAELPDGTKLSTPGRDALEVGGLGRGVHKIAVRKDDTYLGYLTELFNTPYIFGSATSRGLNQSDLLIGADCADLAVYGMRRMGAQVDYQSTYSMDKVAPEVTVGVAERDGAAVDKHGRVIRVGHGKGEIAPGDVLHFPGSRHVAVYFEDRPPLGVLDPNDLMLHTCWAPPTIQPMKDATSCFSFPIRVLRPRKR